MNDCGTISMTTAMLAPHRKPKEVSPSDLDALLGGRKFGKGTEDHLQPDMNPAIPAYDEADMMELQEFCRQRGIIGVNFGGMCPRQTLNMLKGRMGIREQTTSRKILNG